MTDAKRPVALITGGRRGIGLGIAEALIADGFDLAITGIEAPMPQDPDISELTAHGARAIYIQSDLSDLATHQPAVDAVLDAFGSIDCLINNAGIGSVVRGDFLNLLPDNFDRIVDINLRGTVFFTQAVVKAMIASPQHHARSIVNVTSVSAEMSSMERLDYCMTKAALAAFSQGLALRLAASGIDVFELRPGIIKTDMTAGVADKYDRLIGEGLVPQKRWGHPQDLGRIVSSLVSGKFSFATGTVINADGGLSIQRL